MNGMRPLLLRPHDWPEDNHLNDLVFIGRALEEIADFEQFKEYDLIDLVIGSLINKSLCSVIISNSGEIIPIPSERWRINGRDRLFNCAITEDELHGIASEPLSIVLAVRRQLEGARPIFIEESSLDALLGESSDDEGGERRHCGPKPVAIQEAGERWTDADRKAWIRAQPSMTADDGHKRFKLHPQYDGTKQDAFRREWKIERGTTVGRPSRKS